MIHLHDIYHSYLLFFIIFITHQDIFILFNNINNYSPEYSSSRSFSIVHATMYDVYNAPTISSSSIVEFYIIQTSFPYNTPNNIKKMAGR